VEFERDELIEYCIEGMWKPAKYVRNLMFGGIVLLRDKAGLFPCGLDKIRKKKTCALSDKNPNKTFTRSVK